MEPTPPSHAGVSSPWRRPVYRSDSLRGSVYATPPQSHRETGAISTGTSPGHGLGLYGCGQSLTPPGRGGYPDSPTYPVSYRHPASSDFSPQMFLNPLFDVDTNARNSLFSSGLPLSPDRFDLTPSRAERDPFDLSFLQPREFPLPSMYPQERDEDQAHGSQFAHRPTESVFAPEELSRYAPGVDEGPRGTYPPGTAVDNIGWPMHQGVHTSRPPSSEVSTSSSLAAEKVIAGNRDRVRKKKVMSTKTNSTHLCDVCGKWFRKTYNYKLHLKIHDPDRTYDFKCSLPGCEKKFGRKTELERHIATVHENQKPYQCEKCGKRYPRKDTQRRHTENQCPNRFDLDSTLIKAEILNRPQHMSASLPLRERDGKRPAISQRPQGSRTEWKSYTQ